MEWELLNAEEVVRCHVFNLWRHRSRSPRTGEVHDFDVIESRDWVNVVPITTDQQLVLIRQYRHAIAAVTLEIPGGIIDPQDASPRHAGARELLEETGYAAAELLPLGVIHPNPATHTNRCHMFLARAARPVSEPRWDGTEEIAVQLVPVTQLAQLISEGAITHALAVAALLLAQSHL
ncbi:MAG: NUDIX hydrolase [Deltaproteobacteria bacterium]|nr:NUDIX hydrolase [Deltaproteobacteria bacterium]